MYLGLQEVLLYGSIYSYLPKICFTSLESFYSDIHMCTSIPLILGKTAVSFCTYVYIHTYFHHNTFIYLLNLIVIILWLWWRNVQCRTIWFFFICSQHWLQHHSIKYVHVHVTINTYCKARDSGEFLLFLLAQNLFKVE